MKTKAAAGAKPKAAVKTPATPKGRTKAKKAEENRKADEGKFAKFFSEWCDADVYPDTHVYHSIAKVQMTRNRPRGLTPHLD